jgi:restriction endonuclease S subunit
LDSTHVHTLIDNKFELKYLLGLFNSKFIRYIYNLMVQEQGRVFAQVKTIVLKDIPIKLINKKEQNKMIVLVDKIIETKRQTDEADTTALEAQIDQLVYQLYELTAEEIAIVEGVGQ